MSVVMAWAEGERARWLGRAAALDHGREQPEWVRAATRADKLSDLTPAQVSWLVAKGPEAPARALLAEASGPLRRGGRLDLGRVAAARFGVDALPLVLGEASDSADRLGLLVLPYRGPQVATLVAGWLRQLGSARLWARLWLLRHAELAARTLRPAALAGTGRAQRNAVDALRFLSDSGHAANLPPEPAPLLEDETASLVAVLRRARLAAPPEPPPGDPELPLAVESSAAPQPLVEPLDVPGDPHLAADLGQTLLDGWLNDGMPAAKAWILLAQAHVGDDATMDRLAPLIRSWPGKNRWARAVDGLAVLATAGTDVALRHLLAIAEGMSGGPTNDRADTYLAQAAAARGLSVTQLADRLAVDLGLDTGVVLDYGPRSFTIVLDDHLKPHVVDGAGKLLARPPRPGVRDSRPEAYQGFRQFGKELRTAAGRQIARIERDMLAHRRRPAGDLAAVLLPHPILGSITRRLLWGEYHPDGRLLRALRVAEDGSFADLDDTTAAVEPGAALGVVHPAQLGAELAGWVRTFDDYGIVQPFPQLHRPAVALTAAQRTATGLEGFGPLSREAVERLLNNRWLGNGYEEPGHRHTRLHRRLGTGGLALVVEVTPGVPTSWSVDAEEQHITELWVDDADSDHLRLSRSVPLGAADPVALSELLVELHALHR